MARAFTEPVAEPPALLMSYDEWQGWYSTEPGHQGEWANGEVVLFMPPLINHAEIVNFLNRLMGNFIDLHGLGRIYVETTELWLPKSKVARLPDICFVANEHRDRISTHRLEGYADLVVEVVSEDSVIRDHRQKRLEYQLAGIPEYWLVESRPRHRGVAVYGLDDAGTYQELARDNAGKIHSRVLPGFWLDPNWLLEDPLPAPYLLIAQIIAEREPGSGSGVSRT